MQEFQSIGGLAGLAGFRRPRSYPAAALAPQMPIKCPRCESTNTKFCYYNNYNLSQPRHFCKSCRRYWTRGGLLRNVPVGGGTRKSKNSSSSGSKSKSKSSSPKPDRITESAAQSDHQPCPSTSSGILPHETNSTVDPSSYTVGFGFTEQDQTTVGTDLTSQHSQLSGGAGASAAEWAGSPFDLAGAVDPSVSYWNQCNWGETDHPSVYLPYPPS